MKVLVIPDVHLKPWMFRKASNLMQENKLSQAVCLMDIADDWQQQFNLDLYAQTYDAAIAFAEAYPDTLWCWGNHDLCYPWNLRETGNSRAASWLVCEKLRALQEALPDKNRIAYLHRIDDVLFSHGGLADAFVRQYVRTKFYNDVDAILQTINGFGSAEMWQNISPLWYRPQHYGGRLYKPRKLLQVVGHTPMEAVTRTGNLISCDVFSTYPDGRPIGTQEFPVIDTGNRTLILTKTL